MAFQPVPNVAEFVFRLSDASEEFFYNTMYLRDTLVAWTGPKLVNAATALGNTFRDSIMPNLSVDTTFDAVLYRDLGAEFGISGEVQYNTVGGVAGQALPAMVCALVQITCTSGAAPRKGHMFLSRLAETATNGDALEPTFKANLDADLGALFGGTGVPSEAHVRVSRVQNKALRNPAVSNTVASVTTRSTVGVLRERGRDLVS